MRSHACSVRLRGPLLVLQVGSRWDVDKGGLPSLAPKVMFGDEDPALLVASLAMQVCSGLCQCLWELPA